MCRLWRSLRLTCTNGDAGLPQIQRGIHESYSATIQGISQGHNIAECHSIKLIGILHGPPA